MSLSLTHRGRHFVLVLAVLGDALLTQTRQLSCLLNKKLQGSNFAPTSTPAPAGDGHHTLDFGDVLAVFVLHLKYMFRA